MDSVHFCIVWILVSALEEQCEHTVHCLGVVPYEVREAGGFTSWL